MDADYRRNLNDVGTEITDFRQSLFVYTQVMSIPGRNCAIVDAGLKALAFDSGMPTLEDFPNIRYCNPSDEHGVLDVSEAPGGQQTQAYPRPLRSDGELVRLVCRGSRRPG